MDDALLVGGFERLGDLPRDRQRLVAAESGPRAIRSASVVALDQFEDERVRRRRCPRSRRSPDVRMIERGQHLRFALEAREPIRIGGEGSGRTFSATSRPSFVSRAR